jgi:TetR/AcrR family transcriptional repressor of nem operon
MSAGRPRSFSEQEVLTRATDLFWRQGYEPTGLTQLLDHIGMARQSLYNVFGDKRGLYLRVLEEYSKWELAIVDERLTTEAGAYDAICDYLVSIASERGFGDLIVNAACEFGKNDSEVATVVQGHWDKVSARIEQSLVASVAAGDLPAGIDTRRSAWALTQAINSIRVMQRVGVSPDRVMDTANSAIEGIAVNAGF